jgi:hypothetical protein
MNENSFFKSTQTLLLALLLLLAFFREPRHQWMYIAVFGLWAAFWVLRLLAGSFKRLGRLLKKTRKTIASWHQKRSAAAKPETAAETCRRPAETDCSVDRLLMGHVNFRITDKLKAVFPDAVWKWTDAHPEQIARGGAGRIRIESAGEYTHADVMVDDRFRISFMMMKIVNLSDVAANLTDSISDTEVSEPPEPAAVNPADWYEWIGKEILHEVITELNTRGYSKVFIKETGDVYVVEDGNEAVKAVLKNLPGKYLWSDLVGVLNDNELHAKIDTDRIEVAWA